MKRNLIGKLIILAAIVCPQLARSETAAEAWVRRYSQVVDSTDRGAKVTTDSGGNVIVAGLTDDAVNGSDILVIKYSAAGAPLWTNRYNGPGAGYDDVKAIAVDGGGNVIVAGSSFGGSSGSDFVTIKYSSGGVPLWTNRYDGPANQNDYVAAMALDSGGNVYVTGASTGIGTGDDYVTIKYSSAGTLLWSNRYNGTGNGDDFPFSIAVDTNGNAFVTGAGALATPFTYDYLTVAYSSAGAFLWARGYNGPSDDDDEAQAIAVSGTNVFVTGYSYSTNTDYDYVTIAYSTAGVGLWTNRYNGAWNDYDQPFAIATAGTNVFVTGYSHSGPTTFYDYTTIAYTTTGVPLWTNRYNGPANATDQASAMAVDGSGNVFVTGYSYGNNVTVQDYATVALSSGGMVLWITRYNGPGNGSDFGQAVATDSAGNVFVTGYSASGTSEDWATIKYSNLGVAQWTNRYNGVAKSSGVVQAVAIDGAGNVCVTGYSTGNGTGNDYATIKYSGTGTALWTNRFASSGGYYDDEANAIAVDGSGNVFVTGNASNALDRVTIAYSSAGAPLWTNRYSEVGDSGADAQAIAVGSAKIYVAGSSRNSNGNLDYLTIAYSTAGAPLWTNRYNGPPGDGYDEAVALAVDASGNVCVTGYSANTNSEDFATIKYSSSGVPLWTNRYDGPEGNTDDARAVAVDGSGNVYVTGLSYGVNGGDFATLKYSSAGVALWTNRYDGPDEASDEPRAIAADSSGNVFVTGYCNAGSQYDYVTIGYSSTGSGLWTNYYSGVPTYDSDAQAVAVDGNGRVFVTGYADSPKGRDFVTVAYSTNGAALWTNRFSGPGNLDDGPSTSRTIAVPANGSVVVAGGSGVGGHLDLVTVKYVTVPEVRGLLFGVPGPKMSTLTLAGAATNQYVVQFATNLATNLWFNLSTNAAGGNGLWNVVDNSATNSQRFYRALVR